MNHRNEFLLNLNKNKTVLTKENQFETVVSKMAPISLRPEYVKPYTQYYTIDLRIMRWSAASNITCCFQISYVCVHVSQ